jgi:hypothetical protein
MKKPIKLPVLATVTLGVSIALLAFLNAHAGSLACTNPQKLAPATTSNSFPPAPAADIALPTPIAGTQNVAPAADNPSLLDERRRFALGMIETGNDDHEIGGLGEVSRYQIMPSVWQHYSNSRRYHDPETSTEVAQQHWSALHDCFKQQTHREPTDFDMYVLWNTRFGYYAHHGFKAARLDPIVREHAQRFVNLIQRGTS